MNIFYLSEDPVEAAQMMVDRHVVKMILETAQILSTTHRILDGKEVIGINSKSGRKQTTWELPDDRNNLFYNSTHMNHPSTVWARQNVENYDWLYRHFVAIGREYSYRYGKQHLSITKLRDTLSSAPNNMRLGQMTKIPSCMDEKYIISDDPVLNYRNYYKYGKAHLHNWKNRMPPKWITEENNESKYLEEVG